MAEETQSTIDKARWFLARSDVEAAQRILPENDPLHVYINKFWPQLRDDSEYERVYREAGPIEAEAPDIFPQLKYAWRLQMARNFLGSAPPGLKGLDFGTSKGYYVTHLHNETPVKDWTCMDIDPISIAGAKEIARTHANDWKKLEFIAGTEDNIPADGYHVAVLFEVLEHVREPRRVLSVIESKMTPDGYVIMSLPSGPVEFNMWMDQPHRNREHVREYSLEDIYEVFGNKPELRVQYISYHPSRYLPSMLEGCFFVTYRRSDQPIGEIDWGRKLNGTRPSVILPGE